ncbi:hypothetical protein VTJ49DRAFT_7609 [Mycothermus thermophilus]|uniref:Uncharacterized protein n=1 Tax=Humicola insolens TaxID=85995 RepID=A0ABR3VGK6_HUMIN
MCSKILIYCHNSSCTNEVGVLYEECSDAREGRCLFGQFELGLMELEKGSAAKLAGMGSIWGGSDEGFGSV